MKVHADFPKGIAVMLSEKDMSVHRPLFKGRLKGALPHASLFFATTPNQLDSIQEIEAIITPVRPWIDDLTNWAENLKWIHFINAGVDQIWDYSFDKTKYFITKSSGVHTVPMAEYAIGGILHFMKGFHVYAGQQRRKEWKSFSPAESTGQTVAVLGLGAVGKEVAKRAQQMGMRVLGMATSIRDVDYVDEMFLEESLEDMLGQSEFIVVCLPLTPATDRLLDEKKLKSIKPGGYIINVSRGAIIDERTLVELIRSGHLGGAVLDVFETEPLPVESPLWELPNVLITPHVSGATPYYMERVIDIFLENRASLIENGSLTTAVNPVTKY